MLFAQENVADWLTEILSGRGPLQVVWRFGTCQRIFQRFLGSSFVFLTFFVNLLLKLPTPLGSCVIRDLGV